MWHICTLDHYSAVRKSEIKFEGKRTKLEKITLSEVIHNKKRNVSCTLSSEAPHSKSSVGTHLGGTAKKRWYLIREENSWIQVTDGGREWGNWDSS